MSDMKIGVQLFTLRDHIQNYEDTDKTFDYLKNELGVDVVQISAIGDFPVEQHAELVKKYGLDVCVTHKPWARITDDLDKLIEEHIALGCDQIGLGCMPDEYRTDLAAVREFVALANKAGKKMKEKGLTFGYHNHALEFARLEDGRTIMDVLIEETDPEVFFFIPDTYWIHMGGENEAEYLRKLKGRVKVCHFKDWMIKLGENVGSITELGCGNLNLDACYRVCKEIGVSYIVYEQDNNFAVDPLTSAAVSYKNLADIHNRNK